MSPWRSELSPLPPTALSPLSRSASSPSAEGPLCAVSCASLCRRRRLSHSSPNASVRFASLKV